MTTPPRDTDTDTDTDQHWVVEEPTIRAAFSISPRDIDVPPETLAARFYDVVQWDSHDVGGHFAATERPDEVARNVLRAASKFA